MAKPFKKAGLDTIDLSFKPTETLLKQIELNCGFVNHMLAKPEGKADDNPEEGNNDD